MMVVGGNRWGVSRETRPKLIVTTFKVFSFFPLFFKKNYAKEDDAARSVWAAVCFTVRKGSVCIAQYYASLLFHPRCRERSPVAMQFDFAAGPDPLVIRRRRRYLSDRRPIVPLTSLTNAVTLLLFLIIIIIVAVVALVHHFPSQAHTSLPWRQVP